MICMLKRKMPGAHIEFFIINRYRYFTVGGSGRTKILQCTQLTPQSFDVTYTEEFFFFRTTTRKFFKNTKFSLQSTRSRSMKKLKGTVSRDFLHPVFFINQLFFFAFSQSYCTFKTTPRYFGHRGVATPRYPKYRESF